MQERLEALLASTEAHMLYRPSTIKWKEECSLATVKVFYEDDVVLGTEADKPVKLAQTTGVGQLKTILRIRPDQVLFKYAGERPGTITLHARCDPTAFVSVTRSSLVSSY